MTSSRAAATDLALSTVTAWDAQERRMVRRATFYLARMSKNSGQKVYLGGASITACPGVFHPGVSSSTGQFCEWIRARPPAHRFLDFGTGTGALGIVSALAGCTQVTFTDCNAAAIACARANAERNDVTGISRFLITDSADDLDGNYDVIAFAAPYLWFAAPASLRTRYGDLVYSMFDDGDRAKRVIMRACTRILSSDGRFALQIGSMSRESAIAAYAESHGLVCVARHVAKDGREKNIILEFAHQT